MKCKTNLKHQTGCGRQRWRKRKRKSGKTEGGRQTGAALGPVATGCVCVCMCVLGGHSGGVWGHGGRDQSFGASSTGNTEDGERMEGGYGGRETKGERKGCGQF